MLHVSTIKTEERWSEHRGRIEISSRERTRMSLPISDDFSRESEPPTPSIPNTAEKVSCSPVTDNLVHLFEIERTLLLFDFSAASVRSLEWLCLVLILPKAVFSGRRMPNSGEVLTNFNTDAVVRKAACPAFSLRAGSRTSGQYRARA